MVLNPVDLVYAKNSAVVPVPTLKVDEVDPAVEVTGFKVEDKFETTEAFWAVTEMEVPGVIPIIENLRLSAASTVLSEGTLKVAGVLATFAVVILTPFMDSVIEGFADADGAPQKGERSPILNASPIDLLLFMKPLSELNS